MVTNDWSHYAHVAVRELRCQVHEGGNPLLLEYSEDPAFSPDFWLVAFHLQNDHAWITVGRWDRHAAWQQFREVGLVHMAPELRVWRRALHPHEVAELNAHMAGIRGGWPFPQAGICLDGIHCELLLQESDPLIQHTWNMGSAHDRLRALYEWVDVMKMRKYLGKIV